MPIFEKNDQRIYFAHIPKTGGTSLYLAFASSGWKILNLKAGNSPKSTYSLLKKELGIETIGAVGNLHEYKGSIQHAPYKVWEAWGPYTESFAIIRHPESRLRSALRYHYNMYWEVKHKRPPEDFLKSVLRQAFRRPHKIGTLLDGHLMRQSEFIGPSTLIFRFEDDWQRTVCERYDLRTEKIIHRNAGEGRDILMTSFPRFVALAYYTPDYLKFGYPMRTRCSVPASGGSGLG